MATNQIKSESSVLNSFCLRPDAIFEAQYNKEEIILVVRKHPITQLPWILNVIFFILFIILGNLVFADYFSAPQIFIFNLFSTIFSFGYLWANIILWYFTIGIVTNQRIIDIDIYNVIYKEFSATTINKVSDITTKIGGFLGSTMDFGDVFIKTEGFEQNIEFDKVPHPAKIVQIVNSLMEQSSSSNK